MACICPRYRAYIFLVFFKYTQDAFEPLISVETSPGNGISFWIKPTCIKSTSVKYELFTIDPII